MRIVIETLDKEQVFLLEAEPYYTGLTIKRKINYLYEIPWQTQLLSYKSVAFKDDKTLSDYDVQDLDSIVLTLKNETTPEIFSIRVSFLNGQIVMLKVKPTTAIEKIRKGLLDKTGIPLEQMRILYRGVELVDGTVASNKIEAEAELFLVLKLVGS
ncbi:hypothetical protein BD770DRAFT_381198 [Pilaira anomala]|nr:hypothetical protein BD770DRAFT_381198 [Pilaira anomala]